MNKTRSKIQKPVVIGDILENSFERLGIKTKVREWTIMKIYSSFV